ncbi:MAG: hypothetical protein RLY14_81 [Planctomycetota bacterium]|jgi:hypothetical protein
MRKHQRKGYRTNESSPPVSRFESVRLEMRRAEVEVEHSQALRFGLIRLRFREWNNLGEMRLGSLVLWQKKS